MPNAALPALPDGSLAIPGRFRRRLTYDFGLSTTLPTGVTTSGTGSVAATTYATSRGEATFTTAATSGSIARVDLPSVDLSKFEAVALTARGLKWPAASYPTGLSLGLSNSSFGVRLSRTSSQQLLTVVRHGGVSLGLSNVPIFVPYANAVDLTLLLVTQRKQAYILLGDQVVYWCDASGASLGAVTPNLEVSTSSAEAKTASVAALDLDLYLD